ncbi:hypothetical protein GUJ93_ZPchr0001g31790 [Zizania palustris]|uniref:Uncharacterized protein n=1 Tax=Zizania palustris TaxID=103762 RepID=A0A8J5S1N1_ZIZPA|nr:hypothetical protein GUJ93_ZPchr0001g31790 [Zizania palustris]
MIARCLKILVLVSLVPLALKATSSLLGHVAPPCPLSDSEPSPEQPTSTHGSSSSSSGSTVGVSDSASSHQRRRRRMESALAALDARRFRPGGGAAGFEADKRLAPTGSNPLHNLR